MPGSTSARESFPQPAHLGRPFNSYCTFFKGVSERYFAAVFTGGSRFDISLFSSEETGTQQTCLLRTLKHDISVLEPMPLNQHTALSRSQQPKDQPEPTSRPRLLTSVEE
jgi:hypothetical protein